MKQRRVFFALPCSKMEKATVAQWRETHLQDLHAHWVPEANLHLTLAFIGEAGQNHLDRLLALGDCIHGQAFKINLTRLGQWGRGKVVWLAPDETPAELVELVKALNAGLEELELPTDNRPYRPHLTLARHARVHGLADVQPDIELKIDSFALFESVPDGRGVRYDSIKNWVF